jgi:hypothetical protein
MATFSVDSLHPGRVVCDGCGAAVGPIDPCAEPMGDPPPWGLTAEQAARRWPELAEEVGRHEALCLYRSGPLPEGA